MQASGMYVCKYTLLSDVRGVRYLIPLSITFFTILQFLIVCFIWNKPNRQKLLNKKEKQNI